MNLKALVGSGDKIALVVLPFLIVGLILNVAVPRLFDVGGPSEVLRVVSIVVLIPGVTIWIWSAVLILTNVPGGADHEWTLRGGEAPALHSCGVVGRAVDRLSLQHVARGRDRSGPLCRDQDLRAGRRGSACEGVRCHVGCLPGEGAGAVAVSGIGQLRQAGCQRPGGGSWLERDGTNEDPSG